MHPRRRKSDTPSRTIERADRSASVKSAAAAISFAGGTTLDTAGNLLVHGTVVAPITHDHDVTVGLSGRVVGKIKARAIIVDGEVKGDLYAADFIRVTGTGRVFGELHAPRIGVLTGAQLRGRILMRHRADQAQTLDEPSVHRLLAQL